MRNLSSLGFWFLVIVFSAFFPSAWALQNTISDPNISLSLDYPDVITQGSEFVISSVARANVDQVSNITVTITCPDLEIQQESFHIDRLAKDSTFGNNFNATVRKGVPDGTLVANIEIGYFVKGLFDSQPVRHSIMQTSVFTIASKPSLTLDLQTPSDVFSGEPFSIKGTITNKGSDAHDIFLSAYSSELMLSGKKSLSITDLEAGKSTDFEFVVSTQKDIGQPVNAAIHVNGTYSDDGGKTYPVDDSISLFVRQRGLLEIGDANGIWVGQFFIAPVVGVGTIVSSAIGFFIFLWHYRNKKRKRRARKP